MPVEVISTITSVGSWMVGSGTVSTRTSRLPCHRSALIVFPLLARAGLGHVPVQHALDRVGPHLRGDALCLGPESTGDELPVVHAGPVEEVVTDAAGGTGHEREGPDV